MIMLATIANIITGTFFGCALVLFIQALRERRNSEELLEEARDIWEKNSILVDFTADFNRCSSDDDIIELYDKWNDKLADIGVDFNSIVKISRK